jgi:hypothetical protein
MSDRSSEPIERPHWISVAIIAFALFIIPFGLAGPHGATHHRIADLTAEQVRIDRADAIAGFPVPPHPAETPRGPEP